MIIAQKKRKENIVEYILYMWHVEDLLRTCQFNLIEIEKHLLLNYDQPESVRQEIRCWYKMLIDMAIYEGIEAKGHLQLIKNCVTALNDLHIQLIHMPQETVYSSLYYQALPAIVELRTKADNVQIPEIETCLTAVYGYFLLKLQAKEISMETIESVKKISSLLAYLAAKFHEGDVNNNLK